MSIRELTPPEHVEAVAHGLLPDDISRQLEWFATPPPFMRLKRPCVVGDGLISLSGAAAASLAARYEQVLGRRRVVSFVPASGAASRMFKVPMGFLQSGAPVTLAGLRVQQAASSDARELLEVVESLSRFAFYPALLEAAGMAPGSGGVCGEHDDLRPLLSSLLEPNGLDYANLPKGLLAFHRYADGPRTPFEEHLVEASSYARDADGVCRLHFTVSPEHMGAFRKLADEVVGGYAARYNVRYEIEFSTQHASTDSLAVELDGSPFHLGDGSLLFRPGGHGALLENLSAIDADLVFLKNIDNVVPDDANGEVLLWRRVAGTLLIETQLRLFAAAYALEKGTKGAVEQARVLLAELGTRADKGDSATLRDLVDRPLRVCGMVPNTGDPGGGPFWVDLNGCETLQIVETSQVDGNDATQQDILAGSTHFNPVDLACALRDRHGNAYDLHRYVDENAVFLVEKSKDGRPCRSLERPGLWNGAMARWNTLFIEVPRSTFNPAKTINALLSPTHQPRN